MFCSCKYEYKIFVSLCTFTFYTNKYELFTYEYFTNQQYNELNKRTSKYGIYSKQDCEPDRKTSINIKVTSIQ